MTASRPTLTPLLLGLLALLSSRLLVSAADR
jgi:hypothetical protein